TLQSHSADSAGSHRSPPRRRAISRACLAARALLFVGREREKHMKTTTKTKKLGIAAVLVALCTAGAGVALANGDHDGGPRKAELLQKFDTNHDGKLDESEKQAMRAAFAAEAQARKQEMLAKYDTNHDGKLDDAERQAMRHDLAAQRFAKLD